MNAHIKKPDWIDQEPNPGYECYLKEDGSIGHYIPIKYGKSWWSLKSSGIKPFSHYGEEKELKLDYRWLKVTLTHYGWLEQIWYLKTEHWQIKVTEEEYLKTVEDNSGVNKRN